MSFSVWSLMKSLKKRFLYNAAERKRGGVSEWFIFYPHLLAVSLWLLLRIYHFTWLRCVQPAPPSKRNRRHPSWLVIFPLFSLTVTSRSPTTLFFFNIYPLITKQFLLFFPSCVFQPDWFVLYNSSLYRFWIDVNGLTLCVIILFSSCYLDILHHKATLK